MNEPGATWRPFFDHRPVLLLPHHRLTGAAWATYALIRQSAGRPPLLSLSKGRRKVRAPYGCGAG